MPFCATPCRLASNAEPTRDSIGGYAFLPESVPYPICPESEKPMVLFFQFEIRSDFGLSVAPGSHLLAFMSPSVNEIHSFDWAKSGEPLADAFLRDRLKHFKLFVFGPEVKLSPAATPDPYLVHQKLEFAPNADPSDPFLFVGGEPRWYQDEESHPGFDFLCQLSESYPFAKQENAEEQPDSFSDDDYCLFLGNSTYLFTRPEPKDPEEVWVVLQN